MLTYMIAWLQMRLRSEDRGATAVEYALLIAGIAALIVVAVLALGPTLSNIFTNIENQLD